MATPLPLRPAVEHAPDDRSVLALDDDETTAVLGALGSETARSILARLDGDPATATDLADAIGTSLQNTQYHLGKLRDAGLVSEAGTWYSAKGQEMTVYAVSCERLELRLSAPSRLDPADVADAETPRLQPPT